MKIVIRIVGIVSAFMLFFVVLIGLAFLLANKTNGSIQINGKARRYLVYVPDTYEPNRAVPLVMTIHGYAEWPAHQAQISHWNELADQYGFLVVYPAGTGFPLRWRTSGHENDPGSTEDVLFLSELIEQLENDYNIDPKRVYVNGFSNGGGMTYLLACKLQGKIAAIGGISGAYLVGEDCPLIQPIPTIYFHGKQDAIVPFQGGPSKSFDYPFPNIEEWVQKNARRNDCASEPEQSMIGKVIIHQYADCNQNADVLFYIVTDGGHTWPGGDPLPEFIAGYTNVDIDATSAMWDFFQRHPIP